MNIVVRDKYGHFMKGCKIATKNKGIKKPVDFGAKVSKARMGIKLSDITKNRMSISKTGNKNGIGNKSHTGKLKELSPNWIKDRTKIKLDTERGGPLHKQWSKDVKKRDNWKCKISDKNCGGKVVAHHILSWKDFPELRYKINNGITLCHTHHPRKRVDEVKLSPYFQKLVAEME